MRIVLAFSGGLDTSFCVPYLAEKHRAEIVTVTVDTGGFDAGERAAIRARARALGAVEHREIDARQAVWDRFVATLIRGNVLRGEVYPLSVAAERTQQAIEVAKVAREVDADAVAHGSTGAGNDQVRFDVAFHVLLPDLPILTPVRELGWSRRQTADWLVEHGFDVPSGASRYSVNAGLWGTTLGGDWTHDPWAAPPDDAWDALGPAAAADGRDVVIGWERGLPVSLDGERLSGPALVAALSRMTGPLGVGRGIHVGETVLGIKGRIGFEAGAALVLIAAHRELEKLVLTRWQAFWKDHLARFWGDRLHEGQAFDPVMDDIAAMIGHSQRRVEGRTRVRLDEGRFAVTGAESPHSLFAPEVATYGETHALWSGDEARAFARIAAIPARLAAARGGGEELP